MEFKKIIMAKTRHSFLLGVFKMQVRVLEPLLDVLLHFFPELLEGDADVGCLLFYNCYKVSKRCTE